MLMSELFQYAVIALFLASSTIRSRMTSQMGPLSGTLPCFSSSHASVLPPSFTVMTKFDVERGVADENWVWDVFHVCILYQCHTHHHHCRSAHGVAVCNHRVLVRRVSASGHLFRSAFSHPGCVCCDPANPLGCASQPSPKCHGRNCRHHTASDYFHERQRILNHLDADLLRLAPMDQLFQLRNDRPGRRRAGQGGHPAAGWAVGESIDYIRGNLKNGLGFNGNLSSPLWNGGPVQGTRVGLSPARA